VAIPLPSKLAAPAQRALASVKINCLEDLQKFSEKEIKSLHGIGPNALVSLAESMADNGLVYKTS